MNILDAIQARQSIRSFKNKEVSKEIIENILNISRFAPSGGNTQPWKIYVLSQDLMKELETSVLSNLDNVHLIEPLEYLAFVKLMDLSYFILTDSGGIQEEGPSLGKPVLVMRETTERPEAVEAGTVKLVGTNRGKIISEANQLLTNESAYVEMSRLHNPYGDGLATERIVAFIKELE